MNDATESVDIEPSARDAEAQAPPAARRLSIAITIAAVWPSVLAMAAAAILGDDFVALPGLVGLVLWVVSTRSQNVAARWMLMGPGEFKSRLLFGAFLLAVDWCAVTLVFHLMNDGASAEMFWVLAVLKLLCAPLALGWWGIAFLSGERDQIPGVVFPGRTFGVRDLTFGLLAFGLLLAGAKFAFDSAVIDTQPRTLATLLIGGCTLAVWSGAAFVIDMGLRVSILAQESRRRRIGIGIHVALVLLAIIAAALTNGGGADVVQGIFLLAIPYLTPAVIYEAALLRFGVRAINFRSDKEVVEGA